MRIPWVFDVCVAFIVIFLVPNLLLKDLMLIDAIIFRNALTFITCNLFTTKFSHVSAIFYSSATALITQHICNGEKKIDLNRSQSNAIAFASNQTLISIERRNLLYKISRKKNSILNKKNNFLSILNCCITFKMIKNFVLPHNKKKHKNNFSLFTPN